LSCYVTEHEGVAGNVDQVMTEEQLETLRRQISVYSTICQQLVEMHKASVSQQAALPGKLQSCLGSWCLGRTFYIRNRGAESLIAVGFREWFRRLHRVAILQGQASTLGGLGHGGSGGIRFAVAVWFVIKNVDLHECGGGPCVDGHGGTGSEFSFFYGTNDGRGTWLRWDNGNVNA
jgi:hypothetical protein